MRTFRVVCRHTGQWYVKGNGFTGHTFMDGDTLTAEEMQRVLVICAVKGIEMLAFDVTQIEDFLMLCNDYSKKVNVSRN